MVKRNVLLVMVMVVCGSVFADDEWELDFNYGPASVDDGTYGYRYVSGSYYQPAGTDNTYYFADRSGNRFTLQIYVDDFDGWYRDNDDDGVDHQYGYEYGELQVDLNGTVLISYDETSRRSSFRRDLTIRSGGTLTITARKYYRRYGKSGPRYTSTFSHTVTLIEDNVGPAAPSLNRITHVDTRDRPYLYHSTGNTTYYFNPAMPGGGNFTFDVNGLGSDTGVGVLHNSPYVFRRDTNHDGSLNDSYAYTANSYTTINLKGTSYNYPVYWWGRDVLGNLSSSSRGVTLRRDAGDPILDSIEYYLEPAGDESPNSYIVTIYVNAHDALSGLPVDGVRMAFLPGTIEEVEGDDESIVEELDGVPTLGFVEVEANSRYMAKLILQANTIVEPVLRLTDNVSNELTVDMDEVSFPGIPLVQEEGTQFEWGADGVPYLRLMLLAGQSYRDELLGFDELSLAVTPAGGGDPVYTNANFLAIDPVAVEDAGAGSMGMVNATYLIPVPGAESRASYSIGGAFGFDGPSGSTMSVAWGEDYILTVPNWALGGANEVSLVVERTDLPDLALSSADLSTDESTTGSLYFKDTARIVLETLVDAEGDELTLWYWDGSEWKTGLYEGSDDERVMVVELEETTERVRIVELPPGATMGWDYNLVYRFERDSDLAAGAYTFTVADESTVGTGLPASSDGSFAVAVTEEVSDASGIQAVVLFNADGLVDDEEISLDEYELSPDKIDIVAEWDEATATWSYPDYTFAAESDQEVPHSIGLYLQDRAGNYVITFRQVLVDTLAPRLFDLGGDGAASVNDELSYEYDPATGTITLVADGTAADTDYYGTPLTSYDLQWDPASGGPWSIVGETDGTSLALLLEETAGANGAYTTQLAITDYVGNLTTQTVAFYTPARLLGTAETYVSATDQEQDGEGGHQLAWTGLSSAEASAYVIDKLGEDGLYHEVPGLVDGDVSAHELVSYRLYGVNGSGYVSRFAESYIDFERRVANNPPALASVALAGHVAEGEITYAGPYTELTVTTSDYDAGDTLTLLSYVAGELWSSTELSGSGIDTIVLPALDGNGFVWSNGDEYALSFSLQDRWEIETGEEIAGEVVPAADAISFLYDDEGPVVDRYEVERRAGYSVGYGDLIVDLRDESVAVADETVTAVLIGETEESDLEVESVAEVVGQFRISGLPNGREQSVRVYAEDLLGNEREVVLDSIHRDDEAPVLDGVAGDAAVWNDHYLVNRPIFPLTLDWADVYSGLRRIEVRLSADDEIVYTYEYDTHLGETGGASGTWTGTLPIGFEGDEGTAYDVAVRISDRAGNSGEWETLERQLAFDYQGPSVAVEAVSGLTGYRGQRYYAGGAVEYQVVVDDAGEVASSAVMIVDADGETITEMVPTGSAIGDLVDEGERYGLKAVAEDAAGNRGESEIVWFLVDRTAPSEEEFTLTFITDSVRTVGDDVRFTLSGSDGGSGLSAVYLDIGALVDGVFVPSLSSTLPGHGEDGSLGLHYYGESYEYSFALPDGSEGAYTIRVALEDGVGNRSADIEIEDTVLTVTAGEDRIAVSDYLAVSGDAHTLRASWRYLGDGRINYYEYRVVRTVDGSAVSEWGETFDSYAAVSFADPLENGERYAFQVRGVRDDGLEVDAAQSTGVWIDSVAPRLVAASVPTYSRPGEMTIDWQIEEAESAVVELALTLESLARDESGAVVYETITSDEGDETTVPATLTLGPCDLEPLLIAQGYAVDLHDLDLTAAGVIDGDELAVRLSAYDAGGNLLDAYVGTMVVDGSLPPLPMPQDQGDYVNPQKNGMRFGWTFSSVDPHSGVAGYRYQLIAVGEDPDEEGWIELEADAVEVTVEETPVDDGTAVVLALEATNGAGLRRIGYSDGIVVDRTKPEIPSAYIASSASDTPIDYLVGDYYRLYLSAEDLESGVVGYEYQLGTVDAGVWREAGAVEYVAAEELPVVVAVEDVDLAVGDRFAYRVQAINGTGDYALLPATSDEVLYNPAEPEVVAVYALQSGTGITVSWETDTGGIPIATTTVIVSRNDAVVSQATVEGDPAFYRFASEDVAAGLSDGLYRVRVRTTNEQGLVSPVGNAVAAVLYDLTAPAFDLVRFDKYVATDLGFTMNAYDGGTGIAEYRYRLGTACAVEQLTGGWLNVSTRATSYSDEIDFADDLAGGEAAVNHLDGLILSYQVRDVAGNWSAVEYGEPILVDKTGPIVYGLDQDLLITIGGEEWINEGRYITDTNEVVRLFFDGSDGESGVPEYRVAVWPYGRALPTDIEALDWSDYRSVADDPDFTVVNTIEDVTAQRQEGFDDEEVWTALVQARNRAGVASSIVQSPALVVDITAPEVSLIEDSSGVSSEAASSGGVRPIYNEDGTLSYRIDREGGEVIEVSYTVLSPEGLELTGEKFVLERSAGVFELPFEPTLLGGDTGVYTVQIDLTDHGGRTTQLFQELRFNARPLIQIADKETTPGRPFGFDETDAVYDVDGISDLQIEIVDGEGQQLSLEHPSDWTQWSTVLYHDGERVSESSYTLRVTAWDLFGQETSAEASITVGNTRSGPLYADEYWSGEHRITGPVEVGDGITLTIATLTRVLGVLGTGEEDPPGLTIAAGGTLVSEGAVDYDRESLDETGYWEGISVYGTADLDGATVRHARRGITVVSELVETMENLSIEENVIGIHVWGSSVTIRNATITGNEHYGIKEDYAGAVRLIGNIFSGNGHNYYRDGGFLPDIDEINATDGNDGNVRW